MKMLRQGNEIIQKKYLKAIAPDTEQKDLV